MKYRIAALFASFLLSACGPTYRGYTVSEASFKVDGGKTVSFPVTRAGPLPAENEDYKIESAGILASLKKGDASESKLTWAFSFVSKKSTELDSVIIEQITDSGGLELVVRDDSPALKDKNWFGRSVPVSMTKDLLPWLYSRSDSTFIFKFTINAKDGSSIVMYQPSTISNSAKAVYLQVISGK
ncbi:MAG: hypothetical protein LBP94_02600 [Zoogloeaceae bacterium]|jgi:hypothetical protein|nr:hypothetical protein [Zoogloeaceae bacterium]